MKFRKIAFLFPGQGSQSVGMGKDFFENFPIARQTFEEADEILKRDLSRIVLEGPIDELVQTRNSQTGIFVTSYALLRVLYGQFPGLIPSMCAGLSLGEYTALTATKRLSFAEALPVVQARGEYMNAACLAKEGTMAAIFGLSDTQVETLVEELNLPQDLWVANFNCPGQTVISGTLKGVHAGIEAAKKKGGVKVIPLKVHGAFHSGLMLPAQERLAGEIGPLKMIESEIGLVMNVPGDFVSDMHQIRHHLIEQVTHPVRWEQGIKAMKDADLFLEIGCGRVLTGLNKQIVPTALTMNISKISDLDILASKF